MIYLPSCHSTNDIATELVRSGLFEDGTVVITDEQTGGRGQRGAKWVAEPGTNLTFSIVLKPHFLNIRDQFLLSKAMCVGVCQYLEKYSSQACIKWPNDILLGEHKVCGMLVENSIQGTRIASSIAGIGVNINQKVFLTPRATSLGNYVQRDFLLSDEFPKLMRCLDAAYHRLKSAEGRAYIDREYVSKLFGLGQKRLFSVNNQQLNGTVSGVSDSGQLLVVFDNQIDPVAFNHKEIEWIWD